MSQELAPSPIPEIRRLTTRQLLEALVKGWHDFSAAPLYGLFFGGVYSVSGLVLVWLGAGTWTWTLTVSLGFPLVAPFAAVGLYEVSRRLERGQSLDWRGVLGVVARERDRQIPWAGAIILIYFLFWSFLAHMIFALFLGPSAFGAVTSLPMILDTPAGIKMLLAEGIVGGISAFVLFSLTVVSLPLLLDREIDFVTGMLLSLRTVRKNPRVMAIWAALIAVSVLVAMLPWFLGLFIALPVLGHATWHVYRATLA